ncbi:hypothetical protein M404DRAFT_1005520 [Pisolithus tinctorius Marx 270]|uniref:Uncharacterized protein n=1 Tax=Pisolithus tinctorius Marx 270 TaxID=870435 RepID=A0A0C3NRK1_PISTI|nr:hypothetical protein M404DRAFT_1005520 [Pisolithus tinctorius Marx 270]
MVQDFTLTLLYNSPDVGNSLICPNSTFGSATNASILCRVVWRPVRICVGMIVGPESRGHPECRCKLSDDRARNVEECSNLLQNAPRWPCLDSKLEKANLRVQVLCTIHLPQQPILTWENQTESQQQQ